MFCLSVGNNDPCISGTSPYYKQWGEDRPSFCSIRHMWSKKKYITTLRIEIIVKMNYNIGIN